MRTPEQLTFIDLPAVAPKPKPKRQTEAEILEELGDRVLADCAAQGLDPKVLLMALQVRHLRDGYLCKLSKRERWEFIARIVDVVVELDGDGKAEKSH